MSSLLRAISALVFLAASAACAATPENQGASIDALGVATEDLFGGSDRLTVSIAAPTGRLIHEFQAGKHDTTVDGTLTFGDRTFTIALSLRGNSSAYATECSFPKMKVKFADGQDLSGTPFKGHSKLKVNTHCDDRSPTDRTPIGRVPNDVVTSREEVAYRIVRALDVPTYATRLATMTWVDTEAGRIPAAGGFVPPPASMVRSALFIESSDDAAQRFVRSGLIPEAGKAIETSTTTPVDTSPIDPARIMAAQLVQGSIGNYDWFFAPGGGTGQRALWNIDLYGVPGTVVPVVQDFDLSNVVTLRVTGPQGAKGELDKARSAFSDAQLAPVAHALLERRSAVDQAIAGSTELVDGTVLGVARSQVDEFFSELEAIAAE